MRHLMTILEARHLSKSGEVLWGQNIVKNTIHLKGELYCLTALFRTDTTSIPANYYAGLDNRATPASSDTLDNLSQEPTQFSYSRQATSSATGFDVALNNSGVYQATSRVLTFNAVGGTWGPVSNIFLATSVDNTGYLISTAKLDGSHFVGNGEKLTIRMAMTLTDLGDS